MPASTPDSSGSPPPSATRSDRPDGDSAPGGGAGWRTNAVLFVATIASILFAQAFDGHRLAHLGDAFAFAGSLLAILVAHESGHYFAARIHKVEASLPYFIPLPIPGGFGTMGAIIRMRGRIPTRRALLDIGASGPLAGLVLAIPLYAWGCVHSTVIAEGSGGAELGESLLARLIEHVFAQPAPPGMTLQLSPVAFGAWAGMFVTMINLIPAGQLDGGHVAYALFGPKQDRFAIVAHRAMLAFFFVSLASYVGRDVAGGIGLHHVGYAIGQSMFWLFWFEVLAILGTLSSRGQSSPASEARWEDGVPIRTRATAIVGLAVVASIGQDHPSALVWVAWFAGLGFLLAIEARAGVLRKHTLLDHPPTGPQPLDRTRAVIAVVTLVFFALLFMPTPMSM